MNGGMGRLLGLVVPVVLLVAGGAAGTGSVVAALYFHGPPYAESALLWSVPDPRTGTDPTAGLAQFTAARLQRLHPGAEWGPIDYVPGDVRSTRPDMVSVNPIDRYTWGAAAYSVRAGRCYLILSADDPSNPRYGGTYYGRLPAGAPCVGAAATRQSVTSSNEPPE
jgi:hypothetical protein